MVNKKEYQLYLVNIWGFREQPAGGGMTGVIPYNNTSVMAFSANEEGIEKIVRREAKKRLPDLRSERISARPIHIKGYDITVHKKD